MQLSMMIAEEDERELRHQEVMRRLRAQALYRHPHCSDPDHPGCEHCQPEEDDK